jgi:hypothetical protein
MEGSQSSFGRAHIAIPSLYTSGRSETKSCRASSGGWIVISFDFREPHGMGEHEKGEAMKFKKGLTSYDLLTYRALSVPVTRYVDCGE